MGEHRVKKLTVTLKLSLQDRLGLLSVLRLAPPKDRETDRAWMRVFDVLDLDDVMTEGKADAEGRVTFTRAQLDRSRNFEVDEAHVKRLEDLPIASTLEQSRALEPVRIKIEKAAEAFKKE